ncbi:MAG TPA: hypothetical protein VJ853_00470 [Thermoanaerobaculia bacterium]|nr:hypothetical protein [Thermoanaerobaculia bacterium]
MREWLPSICTATLDELIQRGDAAMKEFREVIAEMKEFSRRSRTVHSARRMRFVRIKATSSSAAL